jgi:hypothetical protein
MSDGAENAALGALFSARQLGATQTPEIRERPSSAVAAAVTRPLIAERR